MAESWRREENFHQTGPSLGCSADHQLSPGDRHCMLQPRNPSWPRETHVASNHRWKRCCFFCLPAIRLSQSLVELAWSLD